MRQISTFDATTASSEVESIDPLSSSGASIRIQQQTAMTETLNRCSGLDAISSAFTETFDT
jgi:hypothetical protein